MSLVNKKNRFLSLNALFLFITMLILQSCANNNNLDLKEDDLIKGSPKSIDPGYASGPRSVEKNFQKIKDAENNSTLNSDTDELDPTIFMRDAALMAEEANDYRSSSIHWYRIYEIDPSNKEASFKLARALRYLGGLNKAEEIIIDAMMLWEDDLLLKLEYAKLLIETSRFEEAITLLFEIEKKIPNDPSVLQSIGIALDHLDHHEEARMYYEKALKIGGKSASLLNNYALSYALSGDLEKAEEKLKKAIISRGDSLQPHSNLALVLYLSGKEQEAKDVLLKLMTEENVDKTLHIYSKLSSKQRDIWRTMVR